MKRREFGKRSTETDKKENNENVNFELDHTKLKNPYHKQYQDESISEEEKKLLSWERDNTPRNVLGPKKISNNNMQNSL